MLRSITRSTLAVAVLVVTARSGADGADVVATVGATKITVADLEAKLAEMPAFQRAGYGATPDEVKRGVLEKELIPAALHAERGRAKKVDERPAVRDRIRDVLRQSLENTLREELAAEGGASEDEVRKYYAENLERYQTPERLKIWRILVADRALASKILSEVKAAGGDASTKKWSELARAHSVDDATKMRDGNLGFVRADGSTNMPRVRVDPVLHAAAKKVGDGLLVDEPVAEGKHWAVVWRRGTLAEVTRTLEQEESTIRQILVRSKLKDRMDALLAKLRSEHVRDENLALLEYVSVAGSGDVSSRPRPGVVPRRPPRDPAPKPDERGNR